MVKKNENLIVLAMFCMIIAFIFKSFGNTTPILDIVVFGFIGISVISGGKYVILSQNKKKK